MKSALALFALLSLPVVAVSQQKIYEIYVNCNAVGANNGTSWQDAYTDLSRVLFKAQNAEIFIAEGTYIPYLDKNGDVARDPRMATFNINCGVRLKGGYSVTGFRVSWGLKYRTILSGDVLRNDTSTLAYPAFFHASRQENVYQLLEFTSRCSGVRSRKFEAIEFASAQNPADAFLANYRAKDADSIFFKSCRFYLNAGTDGFRFRNTLSNTPAFLQLDDCTAEQNNVARFMWLSYVNLNVQSSTFNNTYSNHALFLDHTDRSNYGYSCIIRKSTFIERSLTVSCLRFEGMSAFDLDCIDSKFYLKAGLFDYSKQMPVNGAQIIDEILFRQCLVSKDNSFPSALVRLNAKNDILIRPIFEHCTINSFPETTLPFMSFYWVREVPMAGYQGPGILHPAGFRHCIIWGFRDKIIDLVASGGYPLFFWWFAYNNMQTTNGNYGTWVPYISVGNIYTNPLFRSPRGADGMAGTPDDDLHLTYDVNTISPCIDAGNPGLSAAGTDLDGDIRFKGVIDIGCYECCFIIYTYNLLKNWLPLPDVLPQTNHPYSRSAWPLFAQSNN